MLRYTKHSHALSINAYYTLPQVTVRSYRRIPCAQADMHPPLKRILHLWSGEQMIMEIWTIILQYFTDINTSQLFQFSMSSPLYVNPRDETGLQTCMIPGCHYTCFSTPNPTATVFYA